VNPTFPCHVETPFLGHIPGNRKMAGHVAAGIPQKLLSRQS